jgi:hypothetical protein
VQEQQCRSSEKAWLGFHRLDSAGPTGTRAPLDARVARARTTPAGHGASWPTVRVTIRVAVGSRLLASGAVKIRDVRGEP